LKRCEDQKIPPSTVYFASGGIVFKKKTIRIGEQAGTWWYSEAGWKAFVAKYPVYA
jgi:hypothetical protein